MNAKLQSEENFLPTQTLKTIDTREIHTIKQLLLGHMLCMSKYYAVQIVATEYHKIQLIAINAFAYFAPHGP